MAGFEPPARRRAVASFEDTIGRLAAAGYTQVERVSPLEARLRPPKGRSSLRVQMSRTGRIFGGTYALQTAGEEPVPPSPRGLSAGGRGVVRMQGARFRARRDDAAGGQLAERLGSAARLAERLALVHFERIRI